MTNGEAIEVLKIKVNRLRDFQTGGKMEVTTRQSIEAFETAIAAMEKQELKKPKNKEMFKGTLFAECSACGNTMGNFMGRGEYCNKCGQHIDWEEDAE